jgi:uncharacterized protein (DUF1499 family)
MKKTTLSNIALFIALLGFLSAILMVFGSRVGLWEPIVGFSASRQYNDPMGYFVLVVSALALTISLYQGQSKAIIKSLIATLFGMAILAPTINNLFNKPISYPPIHDITTDVDTPPQFVAITEARSGAKNSLIYEGSVIAEQQLKAYPEIKPIITSLTIQDAYAKALNIAHVMNWKIISEDITSMRFEATDSTPFFNFHDDIVVQISDLEHGSRIDLRSVSRIGRGDRGVNAQRIMAFIDHFHNAQ